MARRSSITSLVLSGIVLAAVAGTGVILGYNHLVRADPVENPESSDKYEGFKVIL